MCMHTVCMAWVDAPPPPPSLPPSPLPPLPPSLPPLPPLSLPPLPPFPLSYQHPGSLGSPVSRGATAIVLPCQYYQ